MKLGKAINEMGGPTPTEDPAIKGLQLQKANLQKQIAAVDEKIAKATSQAANKAAKNAQQQQNNLVTNTESGIPQM